MKTIFSYKFDFSAVPLVIMFYILYFLLVSDQILFPLADFRKSEPDFNSMGT